MSSMNYIIGVIGGKGGVGKSVFTANLALSAQKELRTPCLLMDLDNKSCGDQNIIVGLKPLKTVSEFIGYKGVISQTSLKSILSQHSSGLAYLAAVKSPEQSLSGDPRLFSQQLMSLEQNYKYIFVDLGCEIGELQVEVLNRVSALLVLVTPEILVINQTRRILNELMVATLPTQLMQIIVNKHTSTAVQASTIQQALKLPILNFVPNDEAVSMQALSSSRPFVLSHPNAAITRAYHQIIRQLTGGILQKNKQLSRSQMSSVKKPSTSLQKEDFSSDENLDSNTLLKLQIHSELIQEMDLNKDLTKAKTKKATEEIRTKASRIVTRLVDEKAKHLSRQDRSQIIKHVLDEAVGLGALEELLEDRSVTEIMVNGASHIYCEKNGKIQLSPVTFTSNMHLKNIIERIVTPLGRRIDEKTPYVDARLSDGSRVNAVIEPLSIDGPAVTIRKFPSERIVIQDVVKRFGSLTSAMADFLKICVEQGLNVIISGGTGSGKTTLLNVLSAFIPERERIITVEDAAELQMKQTHVVRLETRPANMEGKGAITIRDLIRNSLRMRPDRIIVGECRDGAALDMLSAMNTGHDGSMTTVHANNPREAVARLETLCLMAGMDLPAKAIREQIAGAVNLIVQISRLSDGSRKVKSITEVAGIQGDVVTLQEIFRFKESGFDKNRKIIGQFQAMGRIPTFIERFEQRGIHIPRDLFTTQQSIGSTSKTPVSGSVKPKLGPSRVIRPLPPKKAVSWSFLVQYDLLLYLVFGVCVFFVSYKWMPSFLRFAYDKTTSSQKEIIEIIEKMRIQRDHKKTVMYLWFLSLAMGLIPVVLTLPHFLIGVGIGIVSFFMTWIGVRSVMRSLWARYCHTVVEQMLEGMILMANGMKVGLSVTQSMERVIEGMKGPLSSEFTLVLNKIKLGMSVEEAMKEMAERIPMPDVIMLVTSVNILKETGGNLAETFAVIAETIRSRQKVESKIRALTAQGMMQARIISAVPVVLIGLLYFINRSYAVVLFTTALGWVCLVIIAVLVIIGGKMMKKVATIDV